MHVTFRARNNHGDKYCGNCVAINLKGRTNVSIANLKNTCIKQIKIWCLKISSLHRISFRRVKSDVRILTYIAVFNYLFTFYIVVLHWPKKSSIYFTTMRRLLSDLCRGGHRRKRHELELAELVTSLAYMPWSLYSTTSYCIMSATGCWKPQSVICACAVGNLAVCVDVEG